MFKNMKIGAKMGFGFGLVILLVVAVGGIAILNLITIQTESTRLRDEYVPEVDISNEIERSSLLTMYALRGYNFSFENNYLADGEKYMKAVLDNLALAQDHAEKYPKLAALKEGAANALTAATTYDRLIGETKSSVEDVVAYRFQADTAAQTFMTQAMAYLESQNVAMVQEITRNAGSAALNVRLNKIKWINEIIELGNSLRIANFRGQLLGDYDGMEAALEKFHEVDDIQKNLRPKFKIKSIAIKRLFL